MIARHIKGIGRFQLQTPLICILSLMSIICHSSLGEYPKKFGTPFFFIFFSFLNYKTYRVVKLQKSRELGIHLNVKRIMSADLGRLKCEKRMDNLIIYLFI